MRDVRRSRAPWVGVALLGMAAVLSWPPLTGAGAGAPARHAGPDVHVVVTPEGDLQVTGDAAANDVRLSGWPGLDAVVIDVARGQTVNGRAGPVVATGVSRDVYVALGEGDDTLSTTATRLPRNAFLHLGGGDDTLLLELRADGDLEIRTEGGNDVIGLFEGSGAQGALRIDAGAGDNAVRLMGATCVGRALVVRAGGGRDQLEIDARAVVRGDALLDLGDGGATVDLEGVAFEGAVTVRLGANDDGVTVTGGAFAAGLRLEGGDGVDVFAADTATTFAAPPELVGFEYP